MMFPELKNIIFIEILLRPNFSLRSSGLPYFYRVKLDVIHVVWFIRDGL